MARRPSSLTELERLIKNCALFEFQPAGWSNAHGRFSAAERDLFWYLSGGLDPHVVFPDLEVLPLHRARFLRGGRYRAGHLAVAPAGRQSGPGSLDAVARGGRQEFHPSVLAEEIPPEHAGGVLAGCLSRTSHSGGLAGARGRRSTRSRGRRSSRNRTKDAGADPKRS
jgi:hypothetical protein